MSPKRLRELADGGFPEGARDLRENISLGPPFDLELSIGLEGIRPLYMLTLERASGAVAGLASDAALRIRRGPSPEEPCLEDNTEEEGEERSTELEWLDDLFLVVAGFKAG